MTKKINVVIVRMVFSVVHWMSYDILFKEKDLVFET